MPSDRSELVEFSDFRIDVRERQLLRRGEPVALTAKAFDVLHLLVTNRDRTVTKEEFMETVWAGTVVEEANLTDNISTLRQALGDDAREPRFIRTVPRRGYRFVAEVRDVAPTPPARDATAAQPASPHKEPEPATRLSGRMRWGGLAIVLLVLLSLGAWFARARRASATEDAILATKQLAVLPFKPLVAADRDAALELGMTDALIAKLSRIHQLSVRPTDSVMPYADGKASVRDIAAKLDVDTVLDGKLQKSGDRVRVSVQLVRAEDGVTLWADRFDERFTDIFALQDALSEKVASALQLRLTSAERTSLQKHSTSNPEAYELYLNGVHHWRSFCQEGLLASVNYHKAAIRLDPKFALAWAGLAKAYLVMGIWGPLTPAQAFPQSIEAAAKGVALDPDVAETHIPIVANKLFYLRDWDGARRELDLIERLDPNDAGLNTLRGYYYQAMGQPEKTLPLLQRALEIAPDWQIARNDVLAGLVETRRYQEAIDRARVANELDPNVSYQYFTLADALGAVGRYEEAAAEIRKSPGFKKGTGRYLGSLAWAEAKLGHASEARALIQQAEKDHLLWTNISVAEAYIALGDHDQAFAWLNRAADEGFPFLWDVRNRYRFDPIRKDTRYAALLARIGLHD